MFLGSKHRLDRLALRKEVWARIVRKVVDLLPLLDQMIVSVTVELVVISIFESLIKHIS